MKKTLFVLMALGASVAANAADVEAGKAKAGTCVACHNADFSGNDALKAPGLKGKSAEYIAAALTEFRAGTRTGGNAAMMTPNAANLTDADIENLAAYISSL